jgi:hypothetical protein
MKQFKWNGMMVVIAIAVASLPGTGCGPTPVQTWDPEQDLNSALSMAEATSKTLSQTAMFHKMQEDTAIIMKTIRNAAMLKINTYGKIALTEQCLKTKTYSPGRKESMTSTPAYDSAYLALIEIRFKDMESSSEANGDPTFLELWTRNEKLRAMIGKLNTICATSDSTLVQ